MTEREKLYVHLVDTVWDAWQALTYLLVELNRLLILKDRTNV